MRPTLSRSQSAFAPSIPSATTGLSSDHTDVFDLVIGFVIVLLLCILILHLLNRNCGWVEITPCTSCCLDLCCFKNGDEEKENTESDELAIATFADSNDNIAYKKVDKSENVYEAVYV